MSISRQLSTALHGHGLQQNRQQQPIDTGSVKLNRVPTGSEKSWNSSFDFSGPEKSWIMTYVLKKSCKNSIMLECGP